MQPIDDVASKLEAKTASFVKEHRLPGAAVGIVHGDVLAWSVGVGFADIAARRVPDASTLYRIASITKTFTCSSATRGCCIWMTRPSCICPSWQRSRALSGRSRP
jgi:CubicO group peptidase (beta-lactamase class C family)